MKPKYWVSIDLGLMALLEHFNAEWNPSNSSSRCSSEVVVYFIPSGAYEPPKERPSASYQKVNRTALVVIDSVVVIARVQSGLAVSTIFGSF